MKLNLCVCGHEAKIESREVSDWEMTLDYRVICTSCRRRTQWEIFERHAVEAWNKRSALARNGGE